jgi:hypothetical protein
MPLIDLPFDLLAIIVTFSVTSDINYENYKNTPYILNAHPNFRKSLGYLNNDQWKNICKTIVNGPCKPILGNWHNTFLTLPKNVNLRLSSLASQGEYGKIRLIEDELKEAYSNYPIPKHVIDSAFECESDTGLLQILREILKYRIEPSIHKYIPMRNYSHTIRIHINREFATYIDKFER